MGITFTILALMTIIFFIIARRRHDGSHLRGLQAGKEMLVGVLPLILLAFLVSGLIQVAIPAEIIQTWLGSQAGWKGIMIGSIAGALIPGGPYMSFPIIAAIFHAGAGIGTIVSIITAWCLIGFGQIPFELAIIGTRFMIIRISTALIFPPLAGAMAQHIFGPGM